jgi:hypothetical protein
VLARLPKPLTGGSLPACPGQEFAVDYECKQLGRSVRKLCPWRMEGNRGNPADWTLRPLSPRFVVKKVAADGQRMFDGSRVACHARLVLRPAVLSIGEDAQDCQFECGDPVFSSMVDCKPRISTITSHLKSAPCALV